MRIEIRIAEGGADAMHALLARRLADHGHAIRLTASGRAAPKPAGLATLFALEDALYGRTPLDLSGPWTPPVPDFEDAPDILVAIGGDAPSTEAPMLRPAYDSALAEAAAIAALLDGRSPRISVRLEASGNGGILAEGTPAIPFPFRIRESLGRVRARTVDLITLALQRYEQGLRGDDAPAPAPSPLPQRAPLAFGAQALAGKIAARLRRAAGGRNACHWRVAFRRTAGDGVQERLRWPDAPWSLLPDDRQRYYADPFLFERDGKLHLFVEEFPYATGKGIISVATLGDNGEFSSPRPVLETGVHLSYPFVFERDGVVWMLPETVGARELRLYRAERFPDVWVPDRVLLPDIMAADATLVESDNRIWLLASLTREGQSDWDCLDIFHAPSLDGPFTPLSEGPVVVDAATARGGGHFFASRGAVIRPAQDCSRGYGSGLALCRVNRLDAGGFAQTVVARLPPPPVPGCLGVHTLNAGGGIETIDLLGGDFRPGQKFSFLNQAL